MDTYNVTSIGESLETSYFSYFFPTRKQAKNKFSIISKHNSCVLDLRLTDSNVESLHWSLFDESDLHSTKQNVLFLLLIVSRMVYPKLLVHSIMYHEPCHGLCVI